MNWKPFLRGLVKCYYVGNIAIVIIAITLMVIFLLIDWWKDPVGHDMVLGVGVVAFLWLWAWSINWAYEYLKQP
jgi:hypothetical protein